MYNLSSMTWERFWVWSALGILIYFLYATATAAKIKRMRPDFSLLCSLSVHLLTGEQV